MIWVYTRCSGLRRNTTGLNFDVQQNMQKKKKKKKKEKHEKEIAVSNSYYSAFAYAYIYTLKGDASPVFRIFLNWRYCYDDNNVEML